MLLNSHYEDLEETEHNVEETFKNIFGSDDQVEETGKDSPSDLPSDIRHQHDGRRGTRSLE